MATSVNETKVRLVLNSLRVSRCCEGTTHVIMTTAGRPVEKKPWPRPVELGEVGSPVEHSGSMVGDDSASLRLQMFHIFLLANISIFC